jgi:inhibitor of KinA
MQTVFPAYRIFPLGDSAITIDFGNSINEDINRLVIQLFRDFSENPVPLMIEAVPAYSSLTVYYDLFAASKQIEPGRVQEWMIGEIKLRLVKEPPTIADETRLIRIPVCYEKEFAPDMDFLSARNHVSTEDIIRLHTAKTYHVYMLGFLPGFSYLGEVDEAIAINRKPQPVPVAPGSVGIAGRQTGIYPFHSPGGWQVIGRTPLRLFDSGNNPPTLLQAGDKVQFFSISRHEFANY